MSDEYWTDENTASTITLSKEENGIETKIHLTVFRDDTVNNENTIKRRYSGIMGSFDDSISSNISVTPIVTYNAENAFAFDIQANESISLSFVRKNPCNKIKVLDESTNKFVEQQLPWDSSTDDRHWSNRKWIDALTEYVNRWQVNTDGCVMTYEPLDPSLQLKISRNAYILQFSHKEDTSSAETVSGSISLQIGSMTANAIRSEDNFSQLAGYNEKSYMDKMTIRMTSSDNLAEYLIYCNDVPAVNNTEEKKTLSCVSSYTLKGGPEQPFEYLTMQVSKKRLSVVAPNLVDDIIAGKNRITINAMGRGDFIVTKCSTSGGSYKIVAYSVNETYRSTVLGTTISFGYNAPSTTPFDIIRSILMTSRDVTGTELKPVMYLSNQIAYAYYKENDSWDTTEASSKGCEFDNNSSAWYVLSVCALKLGCKIWFSDNIAYVIDTSITYDMATDPTYNNTIASNLSQVNGVNIQNLYLNTSDPFPLSATPEEMKFPESVCDMIQLGDEGAETVHNSIRVEFDKNKDSRDKNELENGGYNPGMTRTGAVRISTSAGYTYKVDLSDYPVLSESQKKYGVRETVYKIAEIGCVDADAIAILSAKANCDSEQSIGFKLKEMHKETVKGVTTKYWQKYFPTITHVGTIYDYSNDLINKNTSNFKYVLDSSVEPPEQPQYHKMPNKLCLSTFTHNFPEGTTEYWFGIIKPTDVSQNSSEITNALTNQ